MVQTNNVTVDKLWAAAVRCLPTFTPEEQRTGIVLLRELARGAPVTTDQLAQALRLPRASAAAVARESALSPYVHSNEGGDIQGFLGLSVSRTVHRIRVNGRALWTWCAYDTLFLPALLGETADIETRDPETKQEIRLTVSPAGVEAVEPAGIVASIFEPQLWDQSSVELLIASACRLMPFLASPGSGEAWQASHPATILLPLDDAFEFGRRSNAHLFGPELARLASEAA